MEFRVAKGVKVYPIRAELVQLVKLMQQADTTLKIVQTNDTITWSNLTKIPVGTAFREAFQLHQVT
eukprot:7736216-Ditylum_brightwellii.AAC.1